MDAAGLAFGIVPVAIQLVQYLQNVRNAPESRQALIAQFNLYIKYAQQVKEHNKISDKAGQSFEQQRIVLEKLYAILQDQKLQKLLNQPAITVEAQSSTTVEDHANITIDISDASSIISTDGSTIGGFNADATSEAESSNAVGLKSRKKLNKWNPFRPFRTLRIGSKKNPQVSLGLATDFNPQQSVPGSQVSQIFSTSTSKVEKPSIIKTLVEPWVWPFQEEDFKELLQSLEMATSILHKMLQLEHMEISSNVLGKVTDIDNSVGLVSAGLSKAKTILTEVGKEIVEIKEVVLDSNVKIADFSNEVAEMKSAAVKMHSKLEDDAREDAYKWLSPLTFWSTQDNIYSKLEPGTGTWLLDNEKFTKWLRGESRVLFCHGMPGAGKSTLTSLVIQHLSDMYVTKQETGGKRAIGLVFLYCNYSDQQAQTVPSLLGSILRQLEKCCYITPDLTELYTKYWKDKRNLSLKEVMERVKQCASALEKVFLIVDALDECPHQRELLRIHLFDLINSHGNVQLFATSRPDHGTDKFLMEKGCLSLEIRAKDSDVRLYLDARIEQFAKTGENLYNLVQADSELRNEVIDRILQQANGMFLIAELHITSIANIPNHKKLKQALNNLPKDLDDTYCDAIKRIQVHNAESWKIIQKALMLVTFSLDWLEPDALLDAIATHDTGFDKDDRVDKVYLLSNCGGLLIEEEYKDDAHHKTNKFIVRLIHQSAREFFEKHLDLLFSSAYKSSSPTELIVEAHSVITLVCLAYLTTDRGEAYQIAQWDGKILSSDFPFLWYSFCYWGVHASRSSKDHIQSKLYQYFDHEQDAGYSNGSHCYQVFDTFWEFENYPSLRDWTSKQRIHAASGSESIFVAAVVFDLRVLVKEYILQHPTFILSLPASFLSICLTAAAWNGNMDLFRQLWVRASDISLNSNSDIIGSCMRAINPCWAAAFNGHGEVIALLVNNGFDINMASTYGSTPLVVAAAKGHDKVVELLLADDMIDVNMTDKYGRTPLIYAASIGHDKVVELLLADDRADVNMADKYGRTALIYAASNGHDKVVELLLADDMTDVNMTDKNGRTPLIFAASSGHDKVVELLLADDMTDVNMTEKNGRTPLIYAASNGHDKVVQLLLANERIAVNTATKSGGTPLQRAAMKGHNKVVELLVAFNGIDVNHGDKDGDTPLHVAARNGHRRVTELLLAHSKIDIAKANAASETALDWAIEHGHHEIAAILRLKLENDRKT